MSAIIKITTPPAPIIQVTGEGKYKVIVSTPKPVVVEVKGLFPSVFNGSLVIVEDITEPEAGEDFNLS